MNTFVVLLMMTGTPGVDSMPITGSVPSANFVESGESERKSASRPRFFGRIQGFFSRRSRASDRSSPPSSPSQNGVVEMGPVNDTIAIPGPMVLPSIASGQVSPSIIRPESSPQSFPAPPNGVAEGGPVNSP